MSAWSTVAGVRARVAPAVERDRPTEASAVTRRLPVVALVGRPNVGKSTFVARLTGRYEEAANVPGTTVGTVRREVRLDGHDAVLVDLPGSHSLVDQSDGLPRFWQLLLDTRPDAILSVVDAYSAITDERAYKKSRAPSEAIAELRRCAGTQFDPTIVTAFISAMN